MGEKFRKIIYILIQSIIEILFPRSNKCLTCGKEDIEGICSNCYKDMALCEVNELCIGYYKGPLKKLILMFKCNGNFEAGEVLSELIFYKLKDINNDYILTYIPISKENLKLRGFNQCEFIAERLSKMCNLKVLNTLKRVKTVKTQKILTKEEREKNLYMAFDVINKSLVGGKKFLLIDDVITTGATLREGIRALKENGAVDIKILTLAKSHI